MPTEPHYRRIMRLIRERIASGEYPPDTALPSTPALAVEFGAGKSAVRQAVTLLIEAEELRGHQGKGVYVNPRRGDGTE